MELREKVIQTLKEVIDPGTTLDVVSMGLIKHLMVTDDGKVSLEFQPSSNVCPLVLPLALDIQNTLKKLDGVKTLNVTVIDHQKADEVNKYLKEESS
jgi:metal-sulfur cluster biosynthetic enzyme